jgi:hypothetical protein
MINQQPQQQPTEEDLNKEVSLTLKVGVLNVILAGLAELPFKHSDQVIREVISQAQKQLAPKQET